ncbi:hypothetical protein PIB30_006507 [Stylosanthes scabra]|uniref:Uncharacterized protein n=1 Tax=Stylosanthes scabra TaxID=79078 RepID=A0ABU6W2X8_9FABA|nr:hypothetical protein [Stylosanthes scabra]
MDVSDESLYRIHEDASGWLLFDHGASTGHLSEVDDSIAKPAVRCPEVPNVIGGTSAFPVIANLNTAEQGPISDEGVTTAEGSDGLFDLGVRHRDDELVNFEELDDKVGQIEVIETRKVWDKGGISFYNSDEEDVLTRLAERKIVGKGQVDLRPKKQKHRRKDPCLEGRTLTTRTLRTLVSWLSHAGFKEVIKRKWLKLGNASCHVKLKMLKNPIRLWNKEKFGVIDQKISMIENEIRLIDEMAELGTINECNMARGRALRVLAER